MVMMMLMTTTTIIITAQKRREALEIAIRHSRELFQDEFGSAFAAMRVDDHVEVHPMDDQRFKNWISGLYYKEEDDLLSEENLKKIVRILTSRAEFDSTIPKHKLDLRVRGYNNNYDDDNAVGSAVGNVGNVDNVGGINGKELAENFDTIYYDLTNRKWEMIKITPEGWDIDRSDNNPPILFRRYGSEKPQPYPDRHYKPDILDRSLDLINLKQEYKEMQKQLLKPYVISMFYPNILPKPVLVLVAPQGAAKTTAFDLLKDIADPSATLTSSIPKEDHNLIQYMEHNYISYFDNVSDLSNEKSDIICRAVTGSSNTKRKLYENDGDIIYNGRRIVGLNGITNAATRPDLLERGLAIELDEITKKDRKLLRIIWRKYLELKPKLLAFCLDVISEVMKERKKWEGIDDDFFGMEELITQHGGLPRMADWAILAEQISAIIARKEDKPYTPGTFLVAFDKNLEILNSEALKSSLVAEALITFMTFREAMGKGIDIARYGDGFTHWEGSPTVLLSELNRFIEDQPDVGINVKSRAWVQDPAVLGKEIARIAPNLRSLGIIIDSKRTEKNILYRIMKLPTLPTFPTGGDNSRSNEGQNPVGSDVGKPTGLPTTEGGDNHAQNDPAVGNVGNVGKSQELMGGGEAKTSNNYKNNIPYEIIQKAMLDNQGSNNKGYLTKDDFIYASIMEPNWHCSEDQAEQVFYALLEEGKIAEIEPRKYKSNNAHQAEEQEG
jgi:hypothetical protein